MGNRNKGGSMKLIVGLGNPGKQYDQTRHNIGFTVIDELAKRFHIALDQAKFKGLYGSTIIEWGKDFFIKTINLYESLRGVNWCLYGLLSNRSR